MAIFNTKKWAGILFSLLLAVVFSVAAQDMDEVIEKSFKVGEGGLLTVNSDMGAIEVETASGSTLDAKVIRRLDGWSRSEAEEFLKNFQVEFSQSGKDVSVTAKYRGRRSDHHGNLQVRFLFRVPSKYNVNLNTAGGSISVADLEGKVEAETAGGSLSFGNIKGPVNGRTAGGSISLDGGTGVVDVRTSGGSINIGDVDGDLNARTAGGSISIDRAKGNVIAETSGGSIRVDEVMGNIDASTSGGSVQASISQQPKGDCRLETSAGSVTVYLADNVAVDVDARASWGRIESDFPIGGGADTEESSLHGKINGGGPKLVLRSSSGKVKIRKR